jgi:hypothetical protein
VIGAAELAGPLDGHDVRGLLDDADGALVAALVGTDPTELALGDVEATLAVADLLLDGEQDVGESLDVLGIGLQEVEGNPLRAFGTDARQSPAQRMP